MESEDFDQQWSIESRLNVIQKRMLKNAGSGAFGVACFDFLLGVVGVIGGVMRMIRSKSFYPFLIPEGFEDTLIGPFSRRYFYMGIDLTSIFLLIFALFLLAGIQLRRNSLIHIWYCPNAIFLIGHGLMVMIGSFMEQWYGYTTVIAFLGIRIMSVMIIFNFTQTLSDYELEKYNLKKRYRDNVENEFARQQNHQHLANLQRQAIDRETNDVSGGIFAKTDDTTENVNKGNPPQYFANPEQFYTNSKLRQHLEYGYEY